MKDEEKSTLQAAVLDWRKKYGLQDGDPMLAVIELWEIYFDQARLPESRGSHLEDFRKSVLQLDHLEKSILTQAGELIQELRAIPAIRNDLNSFPKFALMFVSGLALLLGIFLGKFLI